MIFSYAHLSVFQPCSCDMKIILGRLQNSCKIKNLEQIQIDLEKEDYERKDYKKNNDKNDQIDIKVKGCKPELDD